MEGLAARACAGGGSAPWRDDSAGQKYLLWVARNPLKSLESDEGIQENPSPFPWSFLVLLGFGLG
jgi:hypothetical protein